MNKTARATAYELVSKQASLQEASDLTRERAVLLLWFLRNVVGIDDLAAYDNICDGPDDEGVDGLVLERRLDEDDPETLTIFQSYYTESGKDIGPAKLGRLLSIAAHFKSAASLTSFLNDEKVEPALKRLIRGYSLVSKLQAGDLTAGRLRIRLVLVTTGVLNSKAKALVNSTNDAEGAGYLSVYDLPRIAKIAKVVAAPASAVPTIEVAVPRDDRLIILPSKSSSNRVLVAAVRATDVVTWTGLESRELFALNVRRELKKNRVRDRIDAAIRRKSLHDEFLASHNGMTVTCESFDDSDDDSVLVSGPSVVNGAQSAIAFARGDAEGNLTDDLRVFVKFVEVSGRPHFANTVSERSNTQNAVNPRNLRANSGPQRRITEEFEERFAGTLYVTKPDATLDAAHKGPVIHNDIAAQYLCAVYNQEPWLAVKKNSLFEADNYPRIFRESVQAEHIVLCQVIADQIESERAKFPARYRRSWKLTRLVVIYLVGQALRADEQLAMILDDPKSALGDRGSLSESLKLPIGAARVTLKKREDQRKRDKQDDDYTVDFKNTDELQKLRDKVRDEYMTLQEYNADSDGE